MTKKEKKELALKLKAEIDAHKRERGEIPPKPALPTKEQQEKYNQRKYRRNRGQSRTRYLDETMGRKSNYNRWDLEKW